MRCVRLCAALGVIALLAGCASTDPRDLRAYAVADRTMTMPDESDFLLYSEAPSLLARVPSQSLADRSFWDALSEAATTIAGAPRLQTSTLAGDRVLRVVRSESGVSISFHFLILQQPGSAGTTNVRLQPLIAWRDRFGGQAGTVPMTADDARAPLQSVRPQLVQLAADAMQN